MTWLDETIVHRIVEALFPQHQRSCPSIVLSANSGSPVPRIERTGPVNTFADFVDHVPTSCVVVAETDARHAPAISSDCRENEGIVVVVKRVWWCLLEIQDFCSTNVDSNRGCTLAWRHQATAKKTG